MPQLELTKSIEGRKLNKRTGRPIGEPWVTIPFGSLLKNLKKNGEMLDFLFLGEPYHCRWADVDELCKAAGLLEELEGEGGSSDLGAAAGQDGSVGAVTAQEPAPTLRWERLASSYQETLRAKVPGGWLVSFGNASGRGLTFYPDPDHQWDGLSLP